MSSYEEKKNLELQFLDATGAVVYSGNDLTTGATPDTEDIRGALENQITTHWMGRDPSTKERILAASSPVVYQGVTVGVVRYVTSPVSSTHLTPGPGEAAALLLQINLQVRERTP